MAKDSPDDELMRVIRDWQRTLALREDIWRLRDEAVEAHLQRNKAIAALARLKNEHADHIVRVARTAGQRPL